MNVETGLDNPSQWELVPVSLLSFSEGGEKSRISLYKQLGYGLSKRIEVLFLVREFAKIQDTEVKE